MSVLVQTAGLLICSNVFMTFAWYAHLRNLRTAPWLVAVGISWASRSSKYLLRCRPTGSAIPRCGCRQLQSDAGSDRPGGVRALRYLLHEAPIKLDFLWAALCLMGAVYFIFRA
jgi:uncharacterized protein (DUF486 family)